MSVWDSRTCRSCGVHVTHQAEECRKCHNRRISRERYIYPEDMRFMSKILEDDRTGCWIWEPCLEGKRQGKYGYFKPDGPKRMVLAHRFSYEFFIGPIPKGLWIDHLCENKMCVNPSHLEVVTPRENVRRFFYRTTRPVIRTEIHPAHRRHTVCV